MVKGVTPEQSGFSKLRPTNRRTQLDETRSPIRSSQTSSSNLQMHAIRARAPVVTKWVPKITTDHHRNPHWYPLRVLFQHGIARDDCSLPGRTESRKWSLQLKVEGDWELENLGVKPQRVTNTVDTPTDTEEHRRHRRHSRHSRHRPTPKITDHYSSLSLSLSLLLATPQSQVLDTTPGEGRATESLTISKHEDPKHFHRGSKNDSRGWFRYCAPHRL